MNRLTDRLSDGTAYVVSETGTEGVGAITTQRRLPELIARLARYEDSGLEPEEVEAAKEIAARLALADYPHNFQGERSDIASYMRWITSVLKEAKEWWKNLLEAREDAEKALEGTKNDVR